MPRIVTTEDKDIVNIAADYINSGKIIIFPTETLYALSCSCYNSNAIKKIYEIKVRDKNKALTIFCYNIAQLEKFAYLSRSALLLAKKFFPGPLTLILKSRTDFKLISNDDTIGVRIPDNKFALNLLKKLDLPLIATSVNISGKAAATKIGDIDKDIYKQVDLIIDDGETKYKAPSTIIDATQDKLKIIREGYINHEDIEKTYNSNNS